VRGKQWDLALVDVERALKISTDLGWKEAVARAKAIQELIASKRSSNAREVSAKVAQERFDKRRSARQGRVDTEHARLDALQQGNQDRLKEFVSMVKASKKVDITNLAGVLGIEEPSARALAMDIATKFGFKVDGPAIVFEKGDKAGFLKSLVP